MSIEKGRYTNIAREERLFACNSGVQSLKHVLLDCHLLYDIRTKYGVTDMENGVMNDCFLVVSRGWVTSRVHYRVDSVSLRITIIYP